MQGDDPVLRAVEQMVVAPDFPWPRADGGELWYEIVRLVHSGIRVPPHRLAVAAINAGFSAPDVLGLAWQWKDGKINEADFRENLGRLLSSFLRRVDQKGREDLQRRGLDGEQLSVATDDELLQFHLWLEAEEDRKRVCPALPEDELRSVLAALCTRDWTRTDQWVRVESLRRWLALSPEAIRQAAGSGRWNKTDIVLESPESRRFGARRGGKPAFVLGPRAVAKVLRAYAANGGELGPEAKKAAVELERLSELLRRMACRRE